MMKVTRILAPFGAPITVNRSEVVLQPDQVEIDAVVGLFDIGVGDVLEPVTQVVAAFVTEPQAEADGTAELETRAAALVADTRAREST